MLAALGLLVDVQNTHHYHRSYAISKSISVTTDYSFRFPANLQNLAWAPDGYHEWLVKSDKKYWPYAVARWVGPKLLLFGKLMSLWWQRREVQRLINTPWIPRLSASGNPLQSATAITTVTTTATHSTHTSGSHCTQTSSSSFLFLSTTSSTTELTSQYYCQSSCIFRV